MRFSSRFFTVRTVSWEMSPHRVAGSLTSRHRSRRVKSVSGRTLAMGCISLLRLDGVSFGVGYAFLFAVPVFTQSTVHYLGIPVALLGLAYYAMLLVLGLRRLHSERRWALALPMAGIGVGASIIFTVVQQTAIRATCSLCMLSALLSLGIFIYLVARRPQRPP